MSFKKFLVKKDPDSLLDYKVNWINWLPEGDTIEDSTWTVPDGMTLEDDDFDDTTATAWLSGGTDGETYDVVNHITTAEGREEDALLRFSLSDAF